MLTLIATLVDEAWLSGEEKAGSARAQQRRLRDLLEVPLVRAVTSKARSSVEGLMPRKQEEVVGRTEESFRQRSRG